MKTRSTWFSGSGLWLFRRLDPRPLREDFRAESDSLDDVASCSLSYNKMYQSIWRNQFMGELCFFEGSVVCAQLVVPLLQIPQINGSNAAIGYFWILTNFQLYWADERKEKADREWPNRLKNLVFCPALGSVMGWNQVVYHRLFRKSIIVVENTNSIVLRQIW